ncbi:MAG: helix-turn-helix transcriptional regulator [Dehalococcoidia bacterium]
MEDTRRKLLALLQRSGQAAVEELARELGLAAASVRRHLDILQRDHLVTFRVVRKKTGRPEYAFLLTEQGQESLPKNYDWLLRLLVEEVSSLGMGEVSSRDGKALSQLLLTRAADRLTDGYKAALDGNLENQLSTLLQLLQQSDFSPEVERDGEKLCIRLVNCPFRSIALASGEICLFDQRLIANFLGSAVDQEQCIQQGDPGCCYMVWLTT